MILDGNKQKTVAYTLLEFPQYARLNSWPQIHTYIHTYLTTHSMGLFRANGNK